MIDVTQFSSEKELSLQAFSLIGSKWRSAKVNSYHYLTNCVQVLCTFYCRWLFVDTVNTGVFQIILKTYIFAYSKYWQ